MKTSIRNKKGFTIVELVIVIAVIAILAAVLIPTFANLVEKANLSADEQAVKQMNTALKIYEAENGKPSTTTEAKEALRDSDINADTLAPVTQEYAFYWDPDENLVVLVGPDKATAKNDWQLLSSTGYGVEPKVAVTNIATLKAAVEQSASDGTVLVKLQKDISVASNDFEETITLPNNSTINAAIVVKKGQSLILDMNDHTITDGSKANQTVVFFIEQGGQLTVKNASIDGHRAFWSCGTLTLNHVTSNCTNAVVRCNGLSDTTIISCDLKSTNNYVIATNNGTKEPKSSRITIIGSTIESTALDYKEEERTYADYAGINITIASTVRIEDSTVKGVAHGAYMRGCNAVIKNSTFVSTYSDAETTKSVWGTGNNGPYADLILACGNESDYSAYTTSVEFNCENVTADKVIVHEPEGGKVIVSGIDKYHKCTLGNGKSCTGSDEACGKEKN